MAIPGLNFGDPKSFSNWTNYAGFDASKPMIGVAPPQSESLAPVSPTMAQVGQRISDVGTQLGQGNFMNALKTYQGSMSPITPTAQQNVLPSGNPALVDKNGDGMISEWEE